MFPAHYQELNDCSGSLWFYLRIVATVVLFVYSSTCFERFPAHHQELNDCSGSLWFYLRIVATVVLFVYNLTCFGRFPAHHQELNDCSGSLWFYLRIVVTVVPCSWSGTFITPQCRLEHPLKNSLNVGRHMP
jgi:hypothetical protein